MKYIVTGGAGFIGSHVCQALLEKGAQVVCIDNLNDYYNPEIKERNLKLLTHKNFSFYKVDITDVQALQHVFEKEKPDKVIHLAARAGVRPSIEQPLLYSEVNVTGTTRLLELSREHNVKRFVFASSSSVYGEREKVPFSETDPTDHPISPYAATKKAGEILCYNYSYSFGLPVVCLRFFTVYGPRGRPDMAPYKFMKAIMDGKTIDVYGDGTSMRDYTYIGDITKGILAAAESNLQYEIINLGNSNPVKLSEFIATIEKVVGKKAQLRRLPMQAGDVSKTYADVSKAKELLRWSPTTPLEEGMKKLYQYFEEQ